MTADDARKLSESVAPVDPRSVKLVLSLWYEAINAACRRGRFSVQTWELDVPRTPIHQSARDAAHEQLKKDGFVVETVNGFRNEIEVKVSW